MNARRAALIASVALAILARTALAERSHVISADDVCSASANPCVISEIITVDPPGDLDFGLRDLVITETGRFQAERATILCGSFRVDGPRDRVGITILDSDSYGSLTVTARRGCSLSPSAPCLEDATCASAGLGTCSVGEGTIVLGAQLAGTRSQGPDVELRAAGDLQVQSRVVLNGKIPAGNAGHLTLLSSAGDVLMDGPITIKQAPPHGDRDYGSEAGDQGELTVVAKVDVDVAEPVDLSGSERGGDMTLDAGRDLKIHNDMSRNALRGNYVGDGGSAHMYAGRDLVVSPHGPSDEVTRVTANASNHRSRDSYYGYWAAGQAGNTWIWADGRFRVEQKAAFQSDSPLDQCSDYVPMGGNFYIHAWKGFYVDGPITARGNGGCNRGGKMIVYADGEGAIGPHGLLDVSATYPAGSVKIETTGDLDVVGAIDTRGDPYRYYYEVEGRGGDVSLHGDDLTIRGKLLLGGASSASDFSAWGCRLRIASTGLIDDGCLGNQDCYPGDASLWYNFMAGQSMVAEPGSRILSVPGAPMSIAYGDPARPPVLGGTFTPAPTMEYESWLSDPGDCPSCGDGVLEQGESCDDGNATGGDGCSAVCVNERCIAQTPGYPAAPLCDDGSACTADRCDPAANLCVHEPVCADDIACTQEACTDEICTVTAVDALCDDHDPCTTDLCSPSSGCLHAALVAIACDDGDICTTDSSCQDGPGCVASDSRAALGGRMTVALHGAAADDVLLAKLDVPVAEVLAPVTETGAGIRLVDSTGNVLLETYLSGSLFAATQAPPRFNYRFDDPTGSVSEAGGIRALHVRARTADRVSVLVRVKRPDLDAVPATASFLLSVQFGGNPSVDGCATLPLRSCRSGRKLTCRL